MDATTFRRYDRHVVLNQPPLSMLDHEALASALVEPAALEHQAYEEEIAGILANGRVVRDLTELIALHGREASSEARVSCSSCSSGPSDDGAVGGPWPRVSGRRAVANYGMKPILCSTAWHSR